MKVLPPRSGVSSRTGNEWKTQQFIFEYFENPSDRYSDKVVIETFDTDVMAQLEENATVRIGFGHRYEEYNGNYYNRLTTPTRWRLNQQQTKHQPTVIHQSWCHSHNRKRKRTIYHSDAYVSHHFLYILRDRLHCILDFSLEDEPRQRCKWTDASMSVDGNGRNMACCDTDVYLHNHWKHLEI